MGRFPAARIWLAAAFLAGHAGFAGAADPAPGLGTKDSINTSPFSPRLVSESIIPSPTAIFHIDQGESFFYEMVIDSTLLESDQEPRTRILSSGLGTFPRQQRITESSRLPALDSAGVGLVRQARFRNPRVGAANDSIPPFELQLSSAVIDPLTGKIVKESPSSPGQPDRVDTLRADQWDFSATLWEFYGQWMLHLCDTFFYEKIVSTPPIGSVRLTLKTAGRDTVNGRECYAVEYSRGPAEKTGLKKMYWVDMNDRIVVRVQDAGVILDLITPRRESTMTAPR